MTLNGIDIANYQRDLVPKNMKTTDFIIVKATESNWYVNECFAYHAKAVKDCGKLLGCYHFARPGDMIEQADFFIGAVKKYLGKAILALDWEDNAVSLGPKQAKVWLDRVYKKTGIKPMIYMSKSVCNEYDWSAVKKAGYRLWCAQYPDYSRTGYKAKKDIWTDQSKFGPWGSWPGLFQYTSVGRIPGYSGNLDLDLFNGGPVRWGELATGTPHKIVASKILTTKPGITVSRTTRMINHAKDLADDNNHGYSQARRWGPDYDCSSLMYECASFAGFKVPTEGTRYTGTMIEHFKNAGFKVFEFDGRLDDLDPGDILLNTEEHTELYIGNGKLVGAHCSETGSIDGKPGDQTGYEISVCNVYNYPWTHVLMPPK